MPGIHDELFTIQPYQKGLPNCLYDGVKKGELVVMSSRRSGKSLTAAMAHVNDVLKRAPSYKSCWQEVKTKWFHRCIDTKKIIWPGQTAYYRHVRESYVIRSRAGKCDQWLSTQAFSFRELKGNIDE